MRHKEQRAGEKGASSSTSSSSSSGGRKDKVRKGSYYVWFLGAEECRGLRGGEYVWPVVQYLVEREKDHDPDKVTLHVSGRGIKLVQQATGRGGRHESTRHFIPHTALTYVQQEARPNDDIVSTILLIYNPLTRCPVHVHTYRCDSTETASMLRDHLQQLVQRPEQQAKLEALEARLASRGLLPPSASSRGSDGGSSGSSTGSSGGGGGGGVGGGGGGGGLVGGNPRGAMPYGPNGGEQMATLYDSLAAELREKLGGRSGPLLLPPRDYDTVNRSRGRLQGIDSRRSLNTAVVGVSVQQQPQPQKQQQQQQHQQHSRKSHEDDSAKSSGIGSDDAPSPTYERDFDPLDNQSSSDEEWEAHRVSTEVQNPAGLILVQPPWRNHESQSHQQQQHHHHQQQQQQQQQHHHHHRHPSPTRHPRSNAAFPRSHSPMRNHINNNGHHPHHSNGHPHHNGHHSLRDGPGVPHTPTPTPPRGPSPRAGRDTSPIRPVHKRSTPARRDYNAHARDRSESPVSPRERFQGARDKFLSLERERRQQSHQQQPPPQLQHQRSTEDKTPGSLRRAPSWEAGPKEAASSSSRSRQHRERREQQQHFPRELHGSRDELLWPKSDRDTGYASRDGLASRERRDRSRDPWEKQQKVEKGSWERSRGEKDWDQGYGTRDRRDGEGVRDHRLSGRYSLEREEREAGRKTPDIWANGRHNRSFTPTQQGPRGRSPTREYRMPRVRSPERPEYQRAKSMHDLTRRRSLHDEEKRAQDANKRRSLYESSRNEYRESKDRRYRSHANIRRSSSCSSASSAVSSVSPPPPRYNEIPDNQRFPGLDRATARNDPLELSHSRSAHVLNGKSHQMHNHTPSSKRTYDYPVNGGAAPLHISRSHHDDYRRFKYEHEAAPQFLRSSSVPTGQH